MKLTRSIVNMTDVSILGGGDCAFDSSQTTSVGEVDAWIESLMACKQLSEVDVKKLCDKVTQYESCGLLPGGCTTTEM